MSSSHLVHKPSTVVTTPPWAKDEPPTPKSSISGHPDDASHELRIVDNTSSEDAADTHSRWWTFTRPNTKDAPSSSHVQPPRSTRGRRSMSWLASPSTLKDIAAFSRRDKQRTIDDKDTQNLSTTTSPTSPVGLSDVIMPVMESPWTPQTRGQRSQHNLSVESLCDRVSSVDDAHLTVWQAKRKRFRNFALVNPYAPLLFRFINVSLTSSALGVAVHIRQTELQHHALGALGSSPMVVIIFAPLTLIHVLVAIYLEYFGRPVGLWNTSAKLAHTFSETIFICAWSAALSLCFDNYFTSLIPCTPPSSISWFSQIPRPSSSVLEKPMSDHLCDDQVALICLVGLSLFTYCINLVISLFRIFEKVRYHARSS